MISHESLYKRANKVIPGGVNSPVRAFNSVGGTPIYIDSAHGSHLKTADGRDLIDCCCSWGAMILGHADEDVTEAIAIAASKGTTFGISTPGEIDLAEEIVSNVPFIDKARLVNSGTEAVMTAIRLARGVTGRNTIIKFEGCYHGHSDGLLVSAGSGVLTAEDGATVATAGIPQSIADETLIAPYNNLEAVSKLFEKHPNQISAIIVEPIAGNMGCVPPMPTFLKGLQDIAHENGALLICDEVINAFRFHYGLYCEQAGITPDIVTMGKIIGGGFPLAALGARAEIMDALAPNGRIYQAGTLSGNPVAVAAAITVLKKLKRLNPYSNIISAVNRISEAINTAASKHGVALRVQKHDTIFTPFACDTLPIKNLHEAQQSDAKLYAKFFHGMLDRGVYIEPSQYEVNFISAAHSPSDIEHIISAAEDTLAHLAR